MKIYPDNKLSRFFRISVGIPIAYRYIAAINLDSYDTDEEPNIIAPSDYTLFSGHYFQACLAFQQPVPPLNMLFSGRYHLIVQK
jgi:hypothetical protein